MADILNTLGTYAVAALFGGMMFFPSVVAPMVFKTLEPAQAGKFLRGLFPTYYIYMIATSGLAALCFWSRPSLAIALAFIAATTLAIRQLLVPRINAARDAAEAGDADADARFKKGHRVSVIFNMSHLAIAAWAVWQIA